MSAWTSESEWPAFRDDGHANAPLYKQQLEVAFFPSGHANDCPKTGQTAAIGGLGETLLRWIRATTTPARTLVEPEAAIPTASGLIDLIEIHRDASLVDGHFVVAWEIKATDNTIGSRNDEIHRQLDDYSLRLMQIATNMSRSYKGDDDKLRQFLAHMNAFAFVQDEHIRYGVFGVGEQNTAEYRRLTPKLHEHPADYKHGHLNVAISLDIPGFYDRRQVIWERLRLK
ncbi:MAG: hypothetical protein JWP44_4538 [Mucilaginibacter sp.]|nr:hypothetical protein [Mucilaginibacter sp.]